MTSPANGQSSSNGRMRNIPMPIDTGRLTFVCVTDPRPRLVSVETGEVKVDRSGQTVYQVGLSAADVNGRAELVNVNVSGEPQVRIGHDNERAALIYQHKSSAADRRIAGSLDALPRAERDRRKSHDQDDDGAAGAAEPAG